MSQVIESNQRLIKYLLRSISIGLICSFFYFPMPPRFAAFDNLKNLLMFLSGASIVFLGAGAWWLSSNFVKLLEKNEQ